VSIKLDSINGEVVNGTEVQWTVPTGLEDPHMYDFYVTNNTGSDQSWLITRKIISEPSDWSNYLCWGGLCYPPYPTEVWSSGAGTVVDTETGIINTYANVPTAGDAHYRYYISTDEINFIDSVDIRVSGFVSITSNESSESNILVYPNPAVNTVKFNIQNTENLNVIIYNVNGELVLSKDVNGGQGVDVSMLNEGVYFYYCKDLNSGNVFNDKLLIVR
jgi:hypothetical protein